MKLVCNLHHREATYSVEYHLLDDKIFVQCTMSVFCFYVQQTS